MFTKTLKAYTRYAIVLLTLAAAASGPARPSEAGSPTGGEEKLTARLVKTGLYVISVGGCNSVLRLSQNGFILVDGDFPGDYDALVKKTHKISFSEQPIRALIVTDHLERHTGNNAKFLAAGTQIIAQENVRHNLETYDRRGGAIPLPTITYDHSYTLKMGGVEAGLFHFGNAHTNGDTVVYFPNLKVVAVGDLISQGAPDPDYAAGGSLVGWGPVLGEILKLDFDTVVPGAGPGVSRKGLESYKAKVDTLVSRALGLVKERVPEDQLLARLQTDDLGWKLKLSPDQLDHFYAELSAEK